MVGVQQAIARFERNRDFSRYRPLWTIRALQNQSFSSVRADPVAGQPAEYSALDGWGGV